METISLRSAIGAHTQWIKALMDYMETGGNKNLGLELDEMKCEIGTWLEGPGKHFEHLHEYENLNKVHSEFHESARVIVRLVDNGDTKSAYDEMKPGGSFERLSTTLILAFDELDQKAIAGTDEREFADPSQTGGTSGVRRIIRAAGALLSKQRRS